MNQRSDAKKVYEQERTVTADLAQTLLNRIVTECGLQFSLEIHDPELFVSHCFMHHAPSGLIAAGSGKGPMHFIGAQAESLEHFYLAREAKQVNYPTASIGTVLRQPQFHRNRLFHELSPVEPIRVIDFSGYDGESVVQVPAMLTNPHLTPVNTAERVLAKYASNSGSAFGCTRPEAILHGLQEVIERHDVSALYLYAAGFLSDQGWRQLALTNDHRLPLRSLRVAVRKNEFAGWTAAAWCRDAQFELAPLGSGASACRQLAVRGAIDELVQVMTLSGIEERQEDRQTLRILRRYPKLQSLINFHNISMPEGRPPDFPQTSTSPIEQLAKTVHALQSSGYCPLIRDIAGFGDAAITQVFVPGFDRFNLIRSGNLVQSQHRRFA